MMIEPITITVIGVPVGKARARKGRGGHFYTPEKTATYEAALRNAALQAMGNKPPLTEPLAVTMRAELPIPESWTGKKKNLAIIGGILPTGKPDLDNFQKAALDGFNGIVWRDDAQIVKIVAEKRYGIQPKLIVTVEAI